MDPMTWSWARAAVTCVAALSLGAGVLVDCLPQMPSADQMACCEGHEHDCGNPSVAASCCDTPNQSASRLVVAQPGAKLGPMMPAAHLGAPVVVVIHPRTFARPAHDIDTSPPLFLLNLRI